MITSAWHTQIEKVHLVLASQRLFLFSCAYDWNRANFSLVIKVLRQFFCVGWLNYITNEKDAEHDSILKGRYAVVPRRAPARQGVLNQFYSFPKLRASCNLPGQFTVNTFKKRSYQKNKNKQYLALAMCTPKATFNDNTIATDSGDKWWGELLPLPRFNNCNLRSSRFLFFAYFSPFQHSRNIHLWTRHRVCTNDFREMMKSWTMCKIWWEWTFWQRTVELWTVCQNSEKEGNLAR